jgi:drug/metabolite transporter (DMT)-like permease
MTPRAAVWWLIAVCFVWGVSFVAVKAALVYATPLVLLAIRFGLAGAPIAGSLRAARREEWIGGMVLGLLFWSGFVFQTAGLRDTTPSRSAFITILSTPLVPLVQYAVFRAVPHRLILLAIGLAVAGTWLLTSPGGGLGLNRGDLLTLGCAFMFAGQIVAVGHYARRIPLTRLLALELGASAVLSLGFAPLLESPRLEITPAFAGLMLFLGAGGYWTFYGQLRAQQVLTPTVTALVFCVEPVFASLASYAVYGEVLGPRQLAGGALILVAVACAAMEGAVRTSDGTASLSA